MSTPPAHALDTNTRLAMDRTRLAHERTLMAWVRTATSLISFGFTIYKFFEFESGKGEFSPNAWLSPRRFAMLMIGTGLIALLLSTIEHSRSLKELHDEFGAPRRSVAGFVALMIAVMGLIAFVAAALRR